MSTNYDLHSRTCLPLPIQASFPAEGEGTLYVQVLRRMISDINWEPTHFQHVEAWLFLGSLEVLISTHHMLSLRLGFEEPLRGLRVGLTLTMTLSLYFLSLWIQSSLAFIKCLSFLIVLPFFFSLQQLGLRSTLSSESTQPRLERLSGPTIRLVSVGDGRQPAQS